MNRSVVSFTMQKTSKEKKFEPFLEEAPPEKIPDPGPPDFRYNLKIEISKDMTDHP